ncbi:hypothetical protein BaRGS_00014387 [Batillaria attramentaria]|uniref:U3 small nucleolar RNA-associated protein 14 n=1 Tax=Batillaria attramentaria TaxID=370345 RepID=A0ABD0L4C8_9CAEN
MEKLLTSLPEEEADFPSDYNATERDDDGNEKDVGVDDDRHHAKLLDAISSLDGVKRVKHSLRTEPGKEVSEFGFNSSQGDNKQLLSELMSSVNQTVSHSNIKRQIKDSQKRSKTLPAPLPKHEKEKIQRTVGYEKAVSEVTKWDSVVTANRKAEQLKFPLHQPNAKLINSHIKFTPRTPLELEIAAALKQRDPEHIIAKGKVTTPAEEKALAAMSVEEARERREELLKYRALLYNKESKLRWQNSIKSKRMDRADMDRIQERMRLRHRGGGKFAKKAKLYAKFDDKKREEVQDMLRKGKELTKKLKVESSDSEVEEDTQAGGINVQGESDVKNPWMQVQSVKKPTFSRPQAVTAAVSNQNLVEDEDSEDEGEDMIEKLFAEGKVEEHEAESTLGKKLTQKQKVAKPLKGELTAVTEKGKSTAAVENDNAGAALSSKKGAQKEEEAQSEEDSDEELADSDELSDTEDIEPQKKPSSTATEQNREEDGADSHSDDKMLEETIVSKDAQETLGSEEEEKKAFEDDDVVEEFLAEKKRVVEEETTKDIDLTLPGWGEWGGVGLQPSKQKKKRFTIKAKQEKRADQHLGHVIVTKKKNTGLEKHLVTKVPFPYNTPDDFTATMKTPIGREWNTENAFKRMTKPSIVTKIGTIIEPVDESVLLKKPTKRRTEVDIELVAEKSSGKKKRKGKK